jgi:transcription factor E2F3
MLDYWINNVQESLTQMTKDPSYAEYAYVTFDDIKSLSNLTDNENETLIAVRAPPGTSLEVPDPETMDPSEKEKYQIHLHS